MSRRHLLLGLLVAAVLGVMVLIGRHPTPQQAISLRPALDRATETKAAVERLGEGTFKASDPEERVLGVQLEGFLLNEWGTSISADYPGRTWLQAIALRLQAGGGLRRGAVFSYSVTLLESPAVNAFSLPGGRLFVTTGMLRFLETEAEAAALLGHEMAHVDLRHCIERYQYELKARRLGGAPLAAMAGMGFRLMLQGYQDEQEAEADRWGMQLAARAGYHPQAAQCLFARLASPQNSPRTLPAEALNTTVDSLQDLLASHPDPSARIISLEIAMRECGLDPERQRYYLGIRNRQELRSRSEQEYSEEWVQHRLMVPSH